MAVAYFTEFSDASEDTAQQVAERINSQIGPEGPAGGICHAEGPLSTGGWWTFNVWESEEAAESFFREILVPVLQDIGGGDEYRPRKLAVHWETSQTS